VDRSREGAAATRQRALTEVRTEWVAFLDDDDEFMPHHLLSLITHASATGADFVYSWFTIKDAAGRSARVGTLFRTRSASHGTLSTRCRPLSPL